MAKLVSVSGDQVEAGWPCILQGGVWIQLLISVRVHTNTLSPKKSSLVDNAALIFLSVWIEPRASHMPGVTAINSFFWLNIFLLKLRYITGRVRWKERGNPKHTAWCFFTKRMHPHNQSPLRENISRALEGLFTTPPSPFPDSFLF